MVKSERALQQEIMLRLKAYPVVALPIPNGVWIPAKTAAERTMAGRIINMMKQSGQLVPGAPDLILALKGGGCAFVELKRPAAKTLLGKTSAGRPSDTQVALEARAKELGIAHAYVTSWEEMKAKLVEWGMAPA